MKFFSLFLVIAWNAYLGLSVFLVQIEIGIGIEIDAVGHLILSNLVSESAIFIIAPTLCVGAFLDRSAVS
jgi:hypothetical protein